MHGRRRKQERRHQKPLQESADGETLHQTGNRAVAGSHGSRESTRHDQIPSRSMLTIVPSELRAVSTMCVIPTDVICAPAASSGNSPGTSVQSGKLPARCQAEQVVQPEERTQQPPVGSV